MAESTPSFTPAFRANLVLRGKIECLTGLHIGGSKEKLEIGGVDSPVIRDPRTRYPYIPGSSLKGKMRHLLEYGLGVVSKGAREFGGVSTDTEIVRLFGIGANEKEEVDLLANIGPSRLLVRDCTPDAETIKIWKSLDSELLYTEYKSENGINRITSAANPRFIERVVAGSKFDFEIIYTEYQITEAEDRERVELDLRRLLLAMRLLEHNFLGKSGSRGYGRIRFWLAPPLWVKQEDYLSGEGNYPEAVKPVDAKELRPLSETKLMYYA